MRIPDCRRLLHASGSHHAVPGHDSWLAAALCLHSGHTLARNAHARASTPTLPTMTDALHSCWHASRATATSSSSCWRQVRQLCSCICCLLLACACCPVVHVLAAHPAAAHHALCRARAHADSRSNWTVFQQFATLDDRTFQVPTPASTTTWAALHCWRRVTTATMQSSTRSQQPACA